MVVGLGIIACVGAVLLKWPLEAQFLEPIVTSKALATYTIIRTNYTTTVTEISATTSTYTVKLATESLTVKPDKFVYPNGTLLFTIVWMICTLGVSLASCSVWQTHDTFWRVAVSGALSFVACMFGAIIRAW